MIVESTGGEFYAEARGAQLRDLLDIPIVVRPLIDTSLHKLAVETDPVWVFRIRQRGSWRTRTRAKVSIFSNGNKQFGVSFALPPRTLYSDMYQVMTDLEKAEYRIRGRNIPIRSSAPVSYELDELEMLTKINDERAARIKALPRTRAMPEKLSADIIRLVPALADEVTKRLRYG